MNERIKELKHQAFLWCDENIPDQYSHEIGYGDAWEDKFAELIVRECANIVNSLEQYEGQGDCSTVEYIKQHFGVEE